MGKLLTMSLLFANFILNANEYLGEAKVKDVLFAFDILQFIARYPMQVNDINYYYLLKEDLSPPPDKWDVLDRSVIDIRLGTHKKNRSELFDAIRTYKLLSNLNESTEVFLINRKWSHRPDPLKEVIE